MPSTKIVIFLINLSEISGLIFVSTLLASASQTSTEQKSISTAIS